MESIWNKIKSNEEYLLLGLGVFIAFYNYGYSFTWFWLGILLIGYGAYIDIKKRYG